MLESLSHPVRSRTVSAVGVVCLLALCGLAGCATTGEDGASSVPPPPGSAEARAVAMHLDARTVEVASRSGELGQAGRESELRQIVEESFDIPHIARATLGDYWNSLDAEQRERWVTTYTEFHLVAMAFNWRQFSGARFEYLGEVSAPNGTILVKARLDRAGQGVSVRRDYRLRLTGSGWRIIDIFSPGYVSNAGMRRAEYLAVLGRTDFDGLIEDMRRRIDTRRRR
jgi:ABC-type transporter MlaC component